MLMYSFPVFHKDPYGLPCSLVNIKPVVEPVFLFQTFEKSYLKLYLTQALKVIIKQRSIPVKMWADITSL